MTGCRDGPTMAAMRPRILIVDDHDGFRAVARAMLEDEGFEGVDEAVDGEDATRPPPPGPRPISARWKPHCGRR